MRGQNREWFHANLLSVSDELLLLRLFWHPDLHLPDLTPQLNPHQRRSAVVVALGRALLGPAMRRFSAQWLRELRHYWTRTLDFTTRQVLLSRAEVLFQLIREQCREEAEMPAIAIVKTAPSGVTESNSASPSPPPSPFPSVHHPTLICRRLPWADERVVAHLRTALPPGEFPLPPQPIDCTGSPGLRRSCDFYKMSDLPLSAGALILRLFFHPAFHLERVARHCKDRRTAIVRALTDRLLVRSAHRRFSVQWLRELHTYWTTTLDAATRQVLIDRAEMTLGPLAVVHHKRRRTEVEVEVPAADPVPLITPSLVIPSATRALHPPTAPGPFLTASSPAPMSLSLSPLSAFRHSPFSSPAAVSSSPLIQPPSSPPSAILSENGSLCASDSDSDCPSIPTASSVSAGRLPWGDARVVAHLRSVVSNANLPLPPHPIDCRAAPLDARRVEWFNTSALPADDGDLLLLLFWYPDLSVDHVASHLTRHRRRTALVKALASSLSTGKRFSVQWLRELHDYWETTLDAASRELLLSRAKAEFGHLGVLGCKRRRLEADVEVPAADLSPTAVAHIAWISYPSSSPDSIVAVPPQPSTYLSPSALTSSPHLSSSLPGDELPSAAAVQPPSFFPPGLLCPNDPVLVIDTLIARQHTWSERLRGEAAKADAVTAGLESWKAEALRGQVQPNYAWQLTYEALAAHLRPSM